jgi:hypothetical protein
MIIEKHELEQCYAIKFYVKLGKSATDTCGKIQKAFGCYSVSRAQVLYSEGCNIVYIPLADTNTELTACISLASALMCLCRWSRNVLALPVFVMQLRAHV